MKEAKKRNPDIKLYGLPWAFPGWVGNGTGSPFADGGALTSNYILQWCVLPQVWPALLLVKV